MQEGMELQENALDEPCPVKVAESGEVNLILPLPAEPRDDVPLPRYWEYRVC